MQSARKSVLPCVLCDKKFSVEDVRSGLFFASTMVCRECYERGQAAPYQEWCFGKENQVRDGKVVLYGFDAETEECSQFCPDRTICPQFLGGK